MVTIATGVELVKEYFYHLYKKIFTIHRLRQEAIILSHQSVESTGNFISSFQLIKRSVDFAPAQKQTEAERLFNLLKTESPKILCEIGGLNGGNLYLISQAAVADAIIISIDINYPIERLIAHKKLVKPGQKMHCVKGDTQDPYTFARVKSLLEGRNLDFLFIDGDHSFFGVMNDFIRFSTLVRPGGIIAFHDIQRKDSVHWKNPNLYVGDVPKFWSFIKGFFQSTNEFIEDKNQDGFGIGVLFKS